MTRQRVDKQHFMTSHLVNSYFLIISCGLEQVDLKPVTYIMLKQCSVDILMTVRAGMQQGELIVTGTHQILSETRTLTLGVT